MTRNVGVTFVFEDDLHQVQVPRNFAWRKLREIWQERAERSVSEFSFTFDDENGAKVPSEGSIDDVLSRRTMTIFVQHLGELQIELLGAPHLNFKLRIQNHVTANSLHKEIRERFGIDENREVRLLSSSSVLQADVPVIQQLEGSATLFVDVRISLVLLHTEPLTFHPTLIDDHDRVALNVDLPEDIRRTGLCPADPMAVPAFNRKVKVEVLETFASNSAASLTKEAFHFRLKNIKTGFIVDSDDQLCNCVAIEDIQSGSPTFALSEHKIEVEVNDKIAQKQITVSTWPSSKLSDLFPNDQHTLLIDGERVDSQQTVWSAGIQTGSSVTITQIIELTVFDSRGHIHFVKTDQYESLLDLRQRICGFAEHDSFELWHEGRVLPCDESSLAEHSIVNQSLLFITTRCRNVRLFVEDRASPVILRDVPEGIRFSRFLPMASSALKMALPADTSFTCSCGRVVSDESEQRRSLPEKCCSEEDLQLTVGIPEDHQHRGETLTVSYRLPSSSTFARFLNSIANLNNADLLREFQAVESSLVQNCLLLQKAKNVKLQLDERLDVLFSCEREVQPWSVRPNQTLLDALKAVELKTQRKIADFAVRRDRPLNVTRRATLTFADLKIKDGHLLTVICAQPQDKSSQTDIRTTDKSIGTQVSQTRATKTMQCAADTQCRQTITTQASRKTDTSSIVFPMPKKTAKFWILATNPERAHGSFHRETFNLDVQFRTPHLTASQLRSAIADYCYVDSSSIDLNQDQAKKKDDKTPVFATDGFGLWADRKGKTFSIDEIGYFRENVRLQDDDILPFSPTLRWAIYANMK